MLSTSQKVVVLTVACLALVLVAIACMYPVQSIIAVAVLGNYSR